MDDHFNTSMKQNKSGDLTYLWWFYKWSPVARYIATGATRHQLLWWWHRCLQIPVWGPGICWASYCSPQVSHPPTPLNYLKGKASIYWKLIERGGAVIMTLTVLVEVHPQPHGLVKKPQSPQLLQNKTVLFIAHNGQDIWVIGWNVERE